MVKQPSITAVQGRMRRHPELLALFERHFIHGDERFGSAPAWVQTLLIAWARLSLPRRFFVARATPGGWEHTAYDFASCQEIPVDSREAEHAVAAAVLRFPWFGSLLWLLAAAWAAWLWPDFTVGKAVFKTLVLGGCALAGRIAHVKGAKLFIAYELDPDRRLQVQGVGKALAALQQASRLWLFEPQTVVGRLPTVCVLQSVRNVRANLRLGGLACRGESIWFLPDKVLVSSGGQVRFVAYDRCAVTTAPMEYTEREGRTYRDAVQVGRTWKKVRDDGTPDLSVADNVELPVLRFGRLSFDVGGTRVELLVTNPQVPELFKGHFFDTLGGFDPDSLAGPLPAFGRDYGARRLAGSVAAALRRVPRSAWVVLAVAAALVGGGGTATWLLGAADREVAAADRLYDEGQKAEAVALYRKHPERFWPSGGGDVRNLRRVIEYDLEQGDTADARRWIELVLERGIALEFNSPRARELYTSVKAARERQRVEAETRKRQAEEQERKRREDEEDFQRRAKAAWEKLQKEEKEKAVREEEQRRAEAHRKQEEEEARERAEEAAERKRAAIARAEDKAKPHLAYAQKLIDMGELDKAIQRLKEIIRDYPQTPSAEKAKQLLDKLGEK
jgi:hypothetical protein